jgi:hypothetical protein
MYLRITRSRFDPAAYEQIVPLVEEVTTAIRRLPGVQHVHQGIDRTAGTGAYVSVWDTEEHARFSRDALGDAIGRLQALGVQLEPPELYEIVDGTGADA